jgi:hypothetical protein
MACDEGCGQAAHAPPSPCMGDRWIVVGLHTMVRAMESILYLLAVWCCERPTVRAPRSDKREFLYAGIFSTAYQKGVWSSSR